MFGIVAFQTPCWLNCTCLKSKTLNIWKCANWLGRFPKYVSSRSIKPFILCSVATTWIVQNPNWPCLQCTFGSIVCTMSSVPFLDGMIGLMKQYLIMPNEICVNVCKVLAEVLTLFALIPWLWILIKCHISTICSPTKLQVVGTAYEVANHEMPECWELEVPTHELTGHWPETDCQTLHGREWRCQLSSSDRPRCTTVTGRQVWQLATAGLHGRVVRMKRCWPDVTVLHIYNSVRLTEIGLSCLVCAFVHIWVQMQCVQQEAQDQRGTTRGYSQNSVVVNQISSRSHRRTTRRTHGLESSHLIF